MSTDQPTATATPRTDANTWTGIGAWDEDSAPLRECVTADFARTLERELAEAKAEVARLKVHEGDLVIGAAILEGARQQEAREVDQLRARVAELEQDIKGVLEECSKHITLSNDFPWSEEVYCTFHHFESELKAVRKQANDEFDAIITRNMELEAENATLKVRFTNITTNAKTCYPAKGQP